MNFSNILNEIERIDPEVFERTSQRRHILKSFGAKVAVAALPIALGSMFKKAYAQTGSIVDVLNFALTLEYLEARFYKTAVEESPGLLPSGAPAAAIATIAAHEAQHVTFLQTAITAAGGTPVASPTFDFTAGGLFPDVFTNYATFLAVSQAFEDTGVRAYKGQAGFLMNDNAVLTAALNIHSVEARHASHIRQMRKANNQGDVKPWITGNKSGIPTTAVQPIYDGEENTVQASIQVTGINSTDVTSDAASESFDEPLTRDQVMAIVDPFIT